ncbi:MAG: nickel-dependent hydrogenase large subunit [Polyangiaceae bacterium]|nr:nickel-dependent hydrogenase large subunit [Polyangiaceae bacterium]
MASRTLEVDFLTRVEGEGALRIELDGAEPKRIELRIFEPPRFFESLLRGRDQHEAPDITSRICGICPVAYITSACAALEQAHGIQLRAEHVALRRLLYTGEWIESHGLHVFMLHLPDFLGLPDAMTLAKQEPTLVKNALRIKKVGNSLVRVLGGREIHPINTRVGGFYKAPEAAALAELLSELAWAEQATLEALERLAELEFPSLERDYELVALHAPDRYAIESGRIRSSSGLDIDVSDYTQHFHELQRPHSTALHSLMRLTPQSEPREYLCGPLARFVLNHSELPEDLFELAGRAGLEPTCRNPFKSILARTIEIAFACREAARIIRAYEPPSEPSVPLPPAADAVEGHGASEAPRGLLYHRYRVDTDGLITEAQIVPPTSQNQGSIERDLWDLAPELGRLPLEEATLLAERAIRNHDPCISCATHFLNLEIRRA